MIFMSFSIFLDFSDDKKWTTTNDLLSMQNSKQQSKLKRGSLAFYFPCKATIYHRRMKRRRERGRYYIAKEAISEIEHLVERHRLYHKIQMNCSFVMTEYNQILMTKLQTTIHIHRPWGVRIWMLTSFYSFRNHLISTDWAVLSIPVYVYAADLSIREIRLFFPFASKNPFINARAAHETADKAEKWEKWEEVRK